MKKQYLNALCGVTFVLLGTMAAQAYDFYWDGIYYDITDDEMKEVEVTYRNDDYNSYSGGVVIPSHAYYDGHTYSVMSIGDSAFYECSGLASVAISNGMTSIGNHDFSYCTYLTSVTIPDGMRSIGSYAFRSCVSLTSVDFPDGVTYIGDNAFLNCKNLTSVDIPNGVTSIEKSTFDGCSNLTSVTIPDGVTYIGSFAFRNCIHLTSVNIPNGVTSIGIEIFHECNSLTSITIPDGVTSIGSRAFSGCNSLTSITIPDGVTSIANYAFEKCSSLASVSIPDEVTSLGVSVFEDCSGLTSVTIGSGVTSIGTWAFRGCHSLTSVVWNAMNCEDFADVNTPFYYYSDKTTYNNFDVRGKITTFTFGDNVKHIPAYLCSGMNNLVSVTIPDEVTSIGEYAFRNCDKLTAIIVDTANPAYCSLDGVLFNKNVTTLVAYPTGRQGAYTIPDEVTNIGSCAFEGCSGLTSVSIPDGVTSIEEGAFSSCNALQEIHCHASIPPTLGSLDTQWDDPFSDVPTSVVLYVPCGAEGAYLAAEGWSVFTTVIGVAPQVQVSADDAAMGTATVTQPVECVDGVAEAVIEATANEDYHFTQWSDGNTDNPRTLTVTEDVALTAQFAINTYLVTAEADNTEHGSVTGSGEYEPGTASTIEAIPTEGYHFVQWNDGNTDNPRTLIVTEDVTLTAQFTINTYLVTAEADDTEHGSVTGSGEYEHGTTSTIEAIPAEGYRFVQWSDGNTDNPRTLIVAENMVLTAEFALATYQVNINTSNPNMGTVIGSGTYEHGTTAAIAAIPAEGYRFVQWSDDNTDNPRTLIITEDVELTAEFESIVTTGLDDVNRQQVVTTDHRNILVYGASDSVLSVYTVQGVCLYRGTAEAEPAIIPVPSAGMYVVMVGEEMVKVVVR